MPRPPSGQQLAFQATAQLSFQLPANSAISVAVLALIVRRAFDQPPGGKFLVAASSAFVSSDNFAQLRVIATASAGVTEIVGVIELVGAWAAHPMWRRIDWPNQQPPPTAELDLSNGVASTVADFVAAPLSHGR